MYLSKACTTDRKVLTVVLRAFLHVFVAERTDFHISIDF